MGDHGVHEQRAVRKRRNDLVDFGVEAEGTQQLQLARDGKGDQHGLRPGRQQAHHHHLAAADGALDG